MSKRPCGMRNADCGFKVSPFHIPHSTFHISPGFTLVELMLVAAILVIAIVALLGAFLGQLTLNEHARNLTWAVNDANRVMEQLRQQNVGGSGNPAWLAPGVGAGVSQTVGTQRWTPSWNTWMNGVNPGAPKNIQPDGIEFIAVACQNQNGTAACVDAADPGFDPIRLTVVVCWRHRNRTVGECAWDDGTQLLTGVNDADTDGVIESPATLSTIMTRRQ